MPKAREKGYGLAQKSRVIDGKRYQYHWTTLTRKGALKEIKKLRANGYSARTFQRGKPWDRVYIIYKRKR